MGTDDRMMLARSASAKGIFPFLVGRNSLGAVLQRGEVSQVAVEDFHARNALTYGSPLGLSYPLLDVELLALGRVNRENCELM
jgi:hypothetical protein